jgi:hypothetical protein
VKSARQAYQKAHQLLVVHAYGFCREANRRAKDVTFRKKVLSHAAKRGMPAKSVEAAVLFFLIDYGPGLPVMDKCQRTNALKRRSDDLAAVKYLQSKKLTLKGAEALMKKEGLADWYKKGRALKTNGSKAHLQKKVQAKAVNPGKRDPDQKAAPAVEKLLYLFEVDIDRAYIAIVQGPSETQLTHCRVLGPARRMRTKVGRRKLRDAALEVLDQNSD